MTRILVAAAAFGLSLSAAGACEYQRSVEAKVDQTVVASIAKDADKPMSKPQAVIIPDGKVPTGDAAE